MTQTAIPPHLAVPASYAESYRRKGDELISAVIVPKGTPPTLGQLNAWLTERGLSARRLPEVLQVVEDMPATAAGKIRKVELRRFAEGDR